ncbi:hypothetical protein ACFSTD_09575 [Novosphingobium colocasiae]
MPRRKSHRWLPDNVTAYKDRHGRTRYRYRKTGEKPYHFKAEPGTPEFMIELAEARAGGPIAIGGSRPVADGSMDDLARKLFAAPRWLRMQPSSQYTYRRIIERYLDRVDKRGLRYGTYPARRATVGVLDLAHRRAGRYAGERQQPAQGAQEALRLRDQAGLDGDEPGLPNRFVPLRPRLPHLDR